LTFTLGEAAEWSRPAYWADAEAEHVAQRVLVGRLVDHLHGKKSAMYEVTVRDTPSAACSAWSAG